MVVPGGRVGETAYPTALAVTVPVFVMVILRGVPLRKADWDGLLTTSTKEERLEASVVAVAGVLANATPLALPPSASPPPQPETTAANKTGSRQ
jgi:hypothetical protein